MVACPGLPNKETKYTDGIKWNIELGNSNTIIDDSIDSIHFDCESILGIITLNVYYNHHHHHYKASLF